MKDLNHEALPHSTPGETVCLAAPAVQILATSRERLHLQGEQLYPIQGLEFPDWEAPQDSLDFLATDVRNVPERQRSLRAVFDTSWACLSPAEREVFLQLPVFRGGFRRRAGQAVAGASLRLLTSLASKSLLGYHRARDRYQIHEMLRQYGTERLSEDGEAQTAVLPGTTGHGMPCPYSGPVGW